MPAANLQLGLVAGETSGDLLAGLLLAGLRRRWPAFDAFGVGGPQMQAQGFQAWWPSSRLAVRGYVEVLRHYPGLLRLRRELGERLLAQRPALFIGVDAPDFNLGLEERLRAGGLRTVHFVCPSLWAWRPERVHALKRAADHVLCLFPFEPALLQQHGIAATFVGHPLADEVPLQPDVMAARRALGLQEDRPVVALLPGSRLSEIDAIAPVFLQAAARLKQARPALQLVLPVAPGAQGRLAAVMQAHGQGLELTVVPGRSHEVLAACDVTLIASGTATLEAALFKKPMVVAYRMHPLSHWLMKRKQLQPWVGLPNILCREFVVPERLQDDCTPERLASDVLAWLDAPERQQALAQRFHALHLSLRQDMATKATHAIEALLQAQ